MSTRPKCSTAASTARCTSSSLRTSPTTATPLPPEVVNGKCFIDSAVLAEAGVTDLSRYGGDNPILDIFVDKP